MTPSFLCARLARGFLALAALAGLAVRAAAASPFVEPIRWKSTGPLVAPVSDAAHSLVSIKDPTVVQWGGRYHVYATVADRAGGWNMVYLNFTDWSEAGTARQVYLDTANPGLRGYHCAPQIFFFRPHNKWYLIYQSQQPQYSTTDDLSKPETWTAPKNFFATNPPGTPALWLDYWVICDDRNAYLFSSGDDGKFYRCQTKLEDFPNGFSAPVVVIEAAKFDLFEASCVYRLKDRNQYLAFIECIGRNGNRYFRSFLADRLDGTWTPHLATEDNPFAGLKNMTYLDGVQPWTRDISHGELIRDSADETLTIDPRRLQFLYQGLDQATPSGVEYSQLPYRLALLTQESQAPVITRQPAGATLPAGSPLCLAVAADGNPAPGYQWLRDGVPIAGATRPEYLVAAVGGADAGTYTVKVSNVAGEVTSQPAVVGVPAPETVAQQSRLSALAVRSIAGADAATLIAGVVAEGSTSRTLVIRGGGPDLKRSGVSGVVADPEEILFALDGRQLAFNDNWDQSTRDATILDAVVTKAGLGSFVAGAGDAALLTTVDPGAYTVHLRGKAGGTGVGLIELYDRTAGDGGRLRALAVRSQVGTGEQVLIVGFVISGNQPLKLLVRGVGPALSNVLSGYLADPTLSVVTLLTHEVVAQNDNWQQAANAAATEAAIGQLGLAPLAAGSKDAALLVTLDPGIYTAVISGTNNQTGVALAEIYQAL